MTTDVFVRFSGTKRELRAILSDQFQIRVGGKLVWFLGYIELNLTSRAEAPDYFSGGQFRPYNFALGGTIYPGSNGLGEAGPAHGLIMEVIAQVIAARLKTRTMCYCQEDASCRRYRFAGGAQRKKGIEVIDERTGRAPRYLFR